MSNRIHAIAFYIRDNTPDAAQLVGQTLVPNSAQSPTPATDEQLRSTVVLGLNSFAQQLAANTRPASDLFFVKATFDQTSGTWKMTSPICATDSAAIQNLA